MCKVGNGNIWWMETARRCSKSETWNGILWSKAGLDINHGKFWLTFHIQLYIYLVFNYWWELVEVLSKSVSAIISLAMPVGSATPCQLDSSCIRSTYGYLACRCLSLFKWYFRQLLKNFTCPKCIVSLEAKLLWWLRSSHQVNIY